MLLKLISGVTNVRFMVKTRSAGHSLNYTTALIVLADADPRVFHENGILSITTAGCMAVAYQNELVVRILNV